MGKNTGPVNQPSPYIQPNVGSNQNARGDQNEAESEPTPDTYHSQVITDSHPAQRSLPSFKVKPTSAQSNLSAFAQKQLHIIRDGLYKLLPDILKTIIHELRTLTQTRLFGQRYEKGLPAEELKHYHHPRIVILKGMTINPMYHAVVSFGDPFSPDARFAHINGVNHRPEFMNRDQFIKFMEQEGNPVMSVYTPEDSGEGGVPDLETMHTYLRDISAQDWKWELFHYNCLSFGLNILKAAGCNITELESIADAPRLSVNHAQSAQKKRKKQLQKEARHNLNPGESLSQEEKKARISRPLPSDRSSPSDED